MSDEHLVRSGRRYRAQRILQGGCNGNLQAISRVVEGMTVEQIEGYFKGISCSGRGTSCSDQLATAVRKAKDAE